MSGCVDLRFTIFILSIYELRLNLPGYVMAGTPLTTLGACPVAW